MLSYKMKNLFLNIIAIFFAFTFSWLSVVFSYALFGMNIFEILLFSGIMLYLLFNDIFNQKTNLFSSHFFNENPYLIFFIGYIVFCGFFGFLNNGPAAIQNIITDTRAFLIFFITASIISSRKENNRIFSLLIDKVLPFIVIFDVLYVLFFDNYLFDADGPVKRVNSVLLPYLLMLVNLYRRKFFLALLFLFCLYLESALSFMRAYYVIALFASIVFVIFGSLQSKRPFMFFTSCLFFISSTLIIIYQTFFSNLDEIDPARYIHSIGRTLEFLESRGASDVERINSLILIISDPFSFLLPYGLGWTYFIETINSNYKEYNLVSSMDSAPLYLIFHFGLIFFLIIFVYFLMRSLRLFLESVYSTKNILIMIFSFVPAFLILFTGAAAFTTVPIAFSMGIMIGYYLNFLNLNKSITNK